MSVHGKLNAREKGMVEGIALALQILISKSGDFTTANAIISATGLTVGKMRASEVSEFDLDKLLECREAGDLAFSEHPKSVALRDMPHARFIEFLRKQGACRASLMYVRRHKFGLKDAWEKCKNEVWLKWLYRKATNNDRTHSSIWQYGSTADEIREEISFQDIRRAIKSEWGV